MEIRVLLIKVLLLALHCMLIQNNKIYTYLYAL